MEVIQEEVEDRDSDADHDEEEAIASLNRRQTVDLTVEQTQLVEEDQADELDDFDLLDATIDPTDVKSMMKRRELEAELEYEEYFIKAKTVFRYATRDDNPMRIDE